MKNKFYITTSIMYANSRPHVGFALELIQADVLARHNRQRGSEVYFVTGTDEHGTTVARAAQKQDKEPKALVDEVSAKVRELAKQLNISNNDFIRTTDRERHWPAAVKIWNTLQAAGALYKKEYEGLYCVGHEAFMKKSELQDGLCPLHKTEPEKIKEENWFFKLTDYKDAVRKKIESGELLIMPETRKQEILNLLADAEDVSFSRPSKDLTWGIPVPGDPTQTMYVWADALTNYISALGYGTDEKNMGFWPAQVHLIGKDILRFHAMIWPGMLLAAGLELPKAIYVHGFITVDGQKMSKTIGNVIDPFGLVDKYGSEVTRYFLLREIPSGDDGDFSFTNLEQRYQSDLANGLGNLIQRVATLIETKMNGELIFKKAELLSIADNSAEIEQAVEQFRLHDAVAAIWRNIDTANVMINDRKPWAESPDQFLKTMTTMVALLHRIAWLLEPYMPETSHKIFTILGGSINREVQEDTVFKVAKGPVLFPRLS